MKRTDGLWKTLAAKGVPSLGSPRPSSAGARAAGGRGGAGAWGLRGPQAIGGAGINRSPGACTVLFGGRAFAAGKAPVSVALGDLDGDGALDLTVANRESDDVSVLLNICDGPSCPADLDGSGEVGFGDILAILLAWGNEGGEEDLDGSGVVDFGDVIVVLIAWGPCPGNP